ncbi:hypothetical protein BDF22DRAFT_680005 [Syncephalis plumigaleata]|nr:hypothetical protein BDF22DRAFT_680005 [Syncephalis plumigaleata]
MSSPVVADNEEQTQRITQVRRALEALNHVCTTLRASTCTRVADIQFDGTLFVPHIEKLGAVVSHQVTKICLVCEHGSIPSDTPSIVNQLREGLDALHTMRQNIPESAGATLFKAIDGGITDIIDGIYTWAIVVNQRLDPLSTPEAQTNLDADVRSKAGLVRDACKALAKLPTSNTEAVLRQWRLHKSMVDIAIEKFESVLTDDPIPILTDTMEYITIRPSDTTIRYTSSDDNNPLLDEIIEQPQTEWAHHICQCALASAKLIKQLLQKVEQRGITSTPAPPPSWQDSCLVFSNELFEQVDDMGSLFWFLPLDEDSARSEAYEHLDELYTAANDLAELAREQFTEPHRNWLDLCLTQLDKQRQSVKD